MTPILTLRYETIEPFSIALNDFLSSRSIAVGDLTDVIFAVKNTSDDTDENALVTKTLGLGVTVVEDVVNGDSLAITLAYSDYGVGKLEMGKSYLIGVGFKTVTHTKWLEAHWASGPPILKITQDFFRG